MKEGNGYFRLADRTYRICAGQCFLIYPDQLALYLTDPGKKWEYYWIMLNGTKILSFLETIGFSRENQVISFQGEEVFSHLTGILQSAIKYQTDPVGIALETNTRIRSLLFSLIEQKRNRKLAFVASYPEDNSHLLVCGFGHNHYITHVTKYIHDHFQENISVESLAASLHLNRSYLSTLFRTHSGMSIMTDFVTLHDTNGNGIPEGTDGGIFDGICTYNERPGQHLLEAGDSIGAQYQAMLAYAGLCRARGDEASARLWEQKAAALKDYFNDDWSVLPEDPQGHFVRALSTDGITKYNDFGKETSWFMPLKQITRPGRRNDAYLDFIREKLGSGIGSPQAPTNIESYTYLPELFFLYDRNAEAWKWMQYILSVKELPHEIAAQGPNGDYPEISFTFLQHVVEGFMGVTPNVPGRTLATLSRLPADIGCVTLEGQEIGQNRITLTHRGRSASVLQNLSGDTLQWTARFPGEYQSILVDRQPLPARIREQCGIAFSEVTVPVEMGREIRAELPV